MTEPTNGLDEMDDLELITSWLNGKLDPERAEAVRKRLEEDQAFSDLAEPLLLAWSVPKHLERVPRPEGEWERDFAEFKRRTGFGQARSEVAEPHRRNRWGRYLALLAIVVVGVTSYVVWLDDPSIPAQTSATTDAATSAQGNAPTPAPVVAPTAPPTDARKQVATVSDDTGWVSLNDGIEVRLAPGASLTDTHRKEQDRRLFEFEGAARFRVKPATEMEATMRPMALELITRAGRIMVGEADLTVTTRGDTTDVQVHPLGRPRMGSLPQELPRVSAWTVVDRVPKYVELSDGFGALLVVGRAPQSILPKP